jgi:hypothetical protein
LTVVCVSVCVCACALACACAALCNPASHLLTPPLMDSRVLFQGRNGTIENDELLAFFTKNISGELAGVFAHLATLNSEVSSALNATHAAVGSDPLREFFTRFFLRELDQAIASLRSPIFAAIQGLTEAARSARPTAVPEQEILVTTRSIERGARGGSEAAGPLAAQVDRLAGLVDKLSGRVHCGTIEERGATATLASFEMDVVPDQLETFQQNFTQYLGQVR